MRKIKYFLESLLSKYNLLSTHPLHEVEANIFDEIDSLCKLSFHELINTSVASIDIHLYNNIKPLDDIRIRRPLIDEIYKTRLELVGRSNIIYIMRVMIVFSRRNYNTNYYYPIFNNLILRNIDYFLNILDSRWLLSIADTISESSQDETERAKALACALLMTTIKLYETERRFIEGIDFNDAPPRYREHTWTHLFDGMYSYWIGNGDAPVNMIRRLQKLCANNSPSSKILLELVNRVNNNDTVYSRFKNVHKYNNTQW